MKYPEYRAKSMSKGYCIGNGAIESAISTVCKLVGQRWTKRVAAVLNIRAVFKIRCSAVRYSIFN